jgi:predicted helicase
MRSCVSAPSGRLATLAVDFDAIYVLDPGGNVRRNPKLSGTTHNVFGIQVGVSVEFLVRHREHKKAASIFYSRLDEYWRNEQKLSFLEETGRVHNVRWQAIVPNEKEDWLTDELRGDFEELLPIGNKLTKGSNTSSAIFENYGSKLPFPTIRNSTAVLARYHPAGRHDRRRVHRAPLELSVRTT